MADDETQWVQGWESWRWLESRGIKAGQLAADAQRVPRGDIHAIAVDAEGPPWMTACGIQVQYREDRPVGSMGICRVCFQAAHGTE